MKFDGFTEQAIFEGGIWLAGDLNDIDSLRCQRTSDFRIDEYPCEFNSQRVSSEPMDRRARVKAHRKRIQGHLRNER